MRSDSNKVHAGCQSKHAGDSQNASKSRVTECGKDVDKPAQIAAQDSIIEKLKTEVGEKRACIIKLQTNLDQCRTENTRLQTEYIRSHEMVSDMAALNASILQENSTRTAENTALQRRNTELATELDALRDESDEICIENKEQHNLILAMLPELNRQNELIGELEDKFRRLFLKHARLQVVVRQLTDDQAILDEIDSDNQQYVSENCRISEEVSDSIDRYNDKLSAYKKEELEIIDFNQHCQVHTPADSVE
ncbi:hypothetical protein IW150_004771 [Coemansia sp. RSA 2607]|nr:hypothetical protein IW150_004771 [Coemansia sp. RSA 2607]KAJ2380147.1 hypothetical protein GGI05_006402 [Coemansia sp. RSA 2603]